MLERIIPVTLEGSHLRSPGHGHGEILVVRHVPQAGIGRAVSVVVVTAWV